MRARKFWTDIRMELRPKDRYYKGSGKNKVKYGHEVEVVIIKNKIGTNGKRARFSIYYDRGIDYEDDLINVASNLEVINKAGSWYTYNYDIEVNPNDIKIDTKEVEEDEEKVTEDIEQLEIKQQGKENMLNKIKELKEEKGYEIFEQIRDKVKQKIDKLK